MSARGREAGPLNSTTVDAYRAAIGAVRAALRAGHDGAALAAHDALAGVVDADDLRRVAGALAHIATRTVPVAVRRRDDLAFALDRLAAAVDAGRILPGELALLALPASPDAPPCPDVPPASSRPSTVPYGPPDGLSTSEAPAPPGAGLSTEE